MRVLSLETSSKSGSAAACDSHQLLKELETPPGERTAQSLAPTIASLLEQVQWPVASIELVAIGQGPGSFTGLRMGITTAKTLAYATGAAIVGVNTLQVIAQQVPQSQQRIWALMDAQRQELFAAAYGQDSAGVECLHPTSVLPADQLLEILSEGDLVTGPGVRLIVDRLPPGVQTADEMTWSPRAGTVARLALEAFERRRGDDLWGLTPSYFRKSAAEEKLSGRSRAAPGTL